jgi:hypothetical protein
MRQASKLKQKTMSGATREPAEREHGGVGSAIPLIERLKPIQERFRSLSKPGGLPADKTFFDELSGDI